MPFVIYSFARFTGAKNLDLLCLGFRNKPIIRFIKLKCFISTVENFEVRALKSEGKDVHKDTGKYLILKVLPQIILCHVSRKSS